MEASGKESPGLTQGWGCGKRERKVEAEMREAGQAWGLGKMPRGCDLEGGSGRRQAEMVQSWRDVGCRLRGLQGQTWEVTTRIGGDS